MSSERVSFTLGVVGLAATAWLSLVAWLRIAPPARPGAAMAPVPAASWDLALSRARRIDINAASGAELERLPGVGPALASRIIAYRQSAGPFATAEGLREVPGIGPKTFEALRDYVSVDG